MKPLVVICETRADDFLPLGPLPVPTEIHVPWIGMPSRGPEPESAVLGRTSHAEPAPGGAFGPVAPRFPSHTLGVRRAWQAGQTRGYRGAHCTRARRSARVPEPRRRPHRGGRPSAADRVVDVRSCRGPPGGDPCAVGRPGVAWRDQPEVFARGRRGGSGTIGYTLDSAWDRVRFPRQSGHRLCRSSWPAGRMSSCQAVVAGSLRSTRSRPLIG